MVSVGTSLADNCVVLDQSYLEMRYTTTRSLWYFTVMAGVVGMPKYTWFTKVRQVYHSTNFNVLYITVWELNTNYPTIANPAAYHSD